MKTPIDPIAGIRSGDRHTIQSIWTDLFPAVRKWVKDCGGTEDDAKDVFQDALMVIYDKSGSAGFQMTSKFSTYFLGICRNLVGNLFQKRYRRDVTLSEDLKSIAEEPIDYVAKDRKKLMDNARKQLGQDCQQVLDLFFQGISMVEIAAKLGFASEGYAKRRKHQCKERLVDLVRSQPGFEELLYN